MNHFVEQALREAEKSSMDRQYGAVLVLRNQIVSKGHNYHTVIKSIDSLDRQSVL
jgi:tRNA(Arg) A34 adenosine deaminase TadA